MLRALRNKLAGFLSNKKKDEFLKRLKGDRPRVEIRNAVIGSTFQVYNPASGETINAAMLHQGRWACWTTVGNTTTSAMSYFTDAELCVLVERQLFTLCDGHELTVVDPGKHLVFYGV